MEPVPPHRVGAVSAPGLPNSNVPAGTGMNGRSYPSGILA